jgi:acetylornithine deacetylase
MGFIALAIDAMLDATEEPLSRPLQLALSHDEEIGCVGVRRLLDVLHLAPVRPFLCVIGEPTQMQFVLGHKGKGSYRTYCRGLEAHSSLAPRSVNAIHVACDFIASNSCRSRAPRIPATTCPTAPCMSGRLSAARR